MLELYKACRKAARATSQVSILGKLAFLKVVGGVVQACLTHAAFGAIHLHEYIGISASTPAGSVHMNCTPHGMTVSRHDSRWMLLEHLIDTWLDLAHAEILAFNIKPKDNACFQTQDNIFCVTRLPRSSAQQRSHAEMCQCTD